MKKIISVTKESLAILALDQKNDLKTNNYFSQKIENKNPINPKKLEEVLQELKISLSNAEKDIPNFTKHYHKEIDIGLAKKSPYFKMNHNYLKLKKYNLKPQELYAIDFGGSTLRLMQLKIKNKKTTPEIGFINSIILDKKFKSIKKGELFFDSLAKELKKMLEANKINPTKKLKIGFTFSFVFEHLKNNKTNLLDWSKGFSCSDVVGKDPRILMEQALINNGVNAKINIILTDATATLIAGHQFTNADIGLIMGTSSSLAIELPQRKFKKERLSAPFKKIIVDFNSSSRFNYPQEKLSTRFDSDIKDLKNKDNTNKLGKFYTGGYLDNLFNLLLKEISDIKFTEQPSNSSPLFLAKLLAEIAKIEDPTKELINQLFTKYNLSLNVPDNLTAKKIKDLSLIIFERAALIAAIFIISTVKYIDPKLKKTHIVACDGSIYQHNPFYQKAIAAKLQTLGCDKIIIKNIENASILGAAIVAAT